MRSAFRMASIGKEIADLNVKYNQAEVLAEADAAYWQYLKVCEQVKAAGKYLEVVKELVRNLEDAYRTGMAAQNDLLKAQVKQNEAELMVQKAQNGLALSGMNLCRIVGVDLMSELTVRIASEKVSFPACGKKGIISPAVLNTICWNGKSN